MDQPAGPTGSSTSTGSEVWKAARRGPYGLGLVLALWVLPGPIGCHSSGFDGRVYRGPEVAFRVGPVPPTWKQLEVDQSLLAFRDDAARATVAVNARCGKDSDDVPLRALTRHLFIYFTESRLVREQSFRLDGREALRTELVAALDGVAKHFTVVVLKKDGCVYDFVQIADGPQSDDSHRSFDRFVAGFATLEK